MNREVECQMPWISTRHMTIVPSVALILGGIDEKYLRLFSRTTGVQMVDGEYHRQIVDDDNLEVINEKP